MISRSDVPSILAGGLIACTVSTVARFNSFPSIPWDWLDDAGFATLFLIGAAGGYCLRHVLR